MRTMFRNLFAHDGEAPPANNETAAMPEPQVLHADDQLSLDHNISLLADSDGRIDEKLHKQAEKEVRTAAQDSIKKLHFIQHGHCPKCGEHLRRHLFAAVCDACGWHTFDTPQRGPVQVHMREMPAPVIGDRCHVVELGTVLVIKEDVVIARIPTESVRWIEYLWTQEEIEQRHRQVLDRLTILCAWCNSEANPEADGFHLVQVAFGASQERYCFCSDDCYEAFRKMYPARVHRNCYERNCAECNLCIKRYGDEAEGIQMLAKDYLKPMRAATRMG